MTANLVTQEMLEQDLLKSGEPVLVDFFTTWCGPCKAMVPALDAVAKELEGKVRVVKIDCDQSPAARDKYGVRGVPTLVIFKNGKPTARHVGPLVQRATLRKWVDASVGAPETRAAEPRAVGFKLSNGMDVVVISDDRAPVITQQVWYRAGAADAAPGVAHFLEQLSFMSTRKAGPSSAPANFIAMDSTAYNQRVVKDDLRGAMELEADRMVQLHLTDEDVEAVRRRIIEMRKVLAQYAEHKFLEQMLASVYLFHPYRVPVTGWGHEIETLSLEDAVRFQKLHYAPNNAVLVVAGDVTPDEIKSLAEEVYGKIPANPQIEDRRRTAEPAPTAARRFTFKDSRVSTALFMRYYVVPSYATAEPGEAEALEVLFKSLSLRRRKPTVAGERKVAVAGSYNGLGRDGGLIELHIETSDGDLDAAEANANALLDDWRQKGIGDVEIEQAKKSLWADYFDGLDDRVLAQRYGGAVAAGSTIEQVEAWPAAISKVTRDDIKNVIAKYLDKRRSVTGLLLPEADAGAAAQPLERDAEVA